MEHGKHKLSYIALVVATALSSNIAFAQDDSAEVDQQDSGLERIEVTARKTAENLQEVPVSLTSIGAEQLAQNGISVLTEVQQFSPNTTLQNSRGTNSTLTAFIRGVGQQDPLWGYEPGVGIYIDDVYVARPQGAVLDILDVERVEVLRGPQGTLYGKNTIGGAVKYITRKMTGDAEFKVQATVGDYSRQDFKVSGQIPLIDDQLYLGFAGASLQRDGFGEFLTSDLDGQDTENYNKDVFSGRLTLEFTPTDNLFLRFNYDKTEDESNSKGGYRLLPSLLTDAPVPDSVYDSYTSLPTWNKVETEGSSLTVEYDINDSWSVKSVTAARESYSPTNIDFDNTSLRIFDVPAIYDDEQFSQEFQVNYNSDNLQLVSGLYYFDGESCGHYDAILEVLGESLGLPGFTAEKSGCNNSESYAAYAQGSYSFTEKLSMTLGARYTKEEKEATVNSGSIFGTVYPKSGWVPGYIRDDAAIDAAIVTVLDDSEEWSRFTPRVGVEYQYSNDMMVFASYSQGFKSGTFNPRAIKAEPAADPEIVDSFELGMKSEWNNNLRVNATVFMLDHKDRQYVSVFPNDDLTVVDQRLGNIGDSEALGAELEIQYAATDSLNFSFSAGYIDTEFNDVLAWNGTGYDDISDDFTVSNTPDSTANFAINYNLETDLGSFVFNGNYYYRGEYDLTENGNLLTQDGYGLVNLGINWYSNEGNWEAGLHMKNVTDEEYLVGTYAFVTPQDDGTYLPGTGGDNTLIGYYGDPSTITFTVGYQF